ncbi:hypothetical protein HDU67_010407 [Dinochytrium kinnereticum]|nr:hypothetical protein HDU67_010407 [Dinochytrium kinnereticum]
MSKLPELDLERPGLTPYPAWALASAFILSTVPSLARRPGWPGIFPLVGFAGAYAASGYVTSIDTDQGPSSATAWGITYMFLCSGTTFQARRPGPIALSAAVLATTAVYGREFVDGWIG